jgi:hypothetical protein
MFSLTKNPNAVASSESAGDDGVMPQLTLPSNALGAERNAPAAAARASLL